MKNQTKSWSTIELIMLMVWSSVLTLCVAMIAAYAYLVSPLKKEAVDRGFAEWKVVDNSSGQTQFVWKQSPKLLTFSF